MPSVPLYVVFYFGKQSIEIKSPAVPKNRGAYGSRAEDGTRTRDPNLGKVMLYQLSYFRIVSKNSVLEAGLEPAQLQ